MWTVKEHGEAYYAAETDRHEAQLGSIDLLANFGNAINILLFSLKVLGRMST